MKVYSWYPQFYGPAMTIIFEIDWGQWHIIQATGWSEFEDENGTEKMN